MAVFGINMKDAAMRPCRPVTGNSGLINSVKISFVIHATLMIFTNSDGKPLLYGNAVYEKGKKMYYMV